MSLLLMPAVLGLLLLSAVWWAVLPALRRLPSWDTAVAPVGAHLWALLSGICARLRAPKGVYARLRRPKGVYARLRRPNGVYARLSRLCGNSRTIAVAYAAELIGLLDEARLVDWSQLLGVERGGRIMALMGVVMLVLRLVTRSAVSFRPTRSI